MSDCHPWEGPSRAGQEWLPFTRQTDDERSCCYPSYQVLWPAAAQFHVCIEGQVCCPCPSTLNCSTELFHLCCSTVLAWMQVPQAPAAYNLTEGQLMAKRLATAGQPRHFFPHWPPETRPLAQPALPQLPFPALLEAFVVSANSVEWLQLLARHVRTGHLYAPPPAVLSLEPQSQQTLYFQACCRVAAAHQPLPPPHAPGRLLLSLGCSMQGQG